MQLSLEALSPILILDLGYWSQWRSASVRSFFRHGCCLLLSRNEQWRIQKFGIGGLKGGGEVWGEGYFWKVYAKIMHFGAKFSQDASRQ